MSSRIPGCTSQAPSLTVLWPFTPQAQRISLACALGRGSGLGGGGEVILLDGARAFFALNLLSLVLGASTDDGSHSSQSLPRLSIRGRPRRSKSRFSPCSLHHLTTRTARDPRTDRALKPSFLSHTPRSKLTG